MAVYKPTYCYPYLESVDLTIPDGEKYFTCQIDTSNIKITGYRVELYNENNERIFPQNNSNKISPLSELNDIDGTLGLNGSELRFPFVQHWNSKIYLSYNAIYFKATDYVDYYQKTNDGVDLEGAQIKNGCLIDKNGDPVFIDGSLLFVGDVFILANKLYNVTLNEAVESSPNMNAIIYVKGGDTNAGSILSYNGSEFTDASGSAWCDIAGNSLAISNKGKTYKWQITLYSGERGVIRTTGTNGAVEISYNSMADNEFNTVLTSGTILGSTEDRIQGPISDKIYAKQWLQLLDSKGDQVGTRTRIESYSQSVGHIYPVSGDSRGFTNSMLYKDANSPESLATQFAVYKYSNNIDQITSQNKVSQSVNFPLLENGALYSASGAQPYDYIISGSENIDKFNRACGTNPQLCSTDKDGNPLYKGETVLIWNPKGSKQNPLTGLFTIGYTPSSSQEGDKSIAGLFPSVKETVDIFYSTPDGEYSASATANLTVTVGSGECYIEGKKIENTKVVIEETTNDILGKTIKRTAQKSGTQIILTTQVTQVWDSDPVSATLVASGKSATIVVKSGGSAAAEPSFTFSMLYDWRKISSYIGKVFFVENGEFSNTNILSKAVAGGSNDIVDGGSSTTIEFTTEEPIEIYPESENKFYGEIFKNNIKNGVGTVYVSPFVGLQAGARLYVSDGTVVKAKTVNTTTWAVTYDASAPAAVEAYSSIEPLKYEIRTNFKSSDETPFYAYDLPRLVPWSEQALSVIGTNGYEFLLEFLGQVLTVPTVFSSEIHARYVHVTGQYLQAQNISWTSYRWLLVDEYGQAIQDTGKQYDGLIETTFYGLNGPTVSDVEKGEAVPTTYYPVLIVEDKLGNSLIMGMEIKVSLNPRNLPMEFSGGFDCKTQSVIMKITDYGYPKFSQDSNNKATVLDTAQGVNYPTEAEIESGGKFVSITGENKSLKAADQVKIPTAGAQLKHFFAKDTIEIPDLSKAPKKLATNDEGNIEFHTKVKLDANFCGEIFKYSVDIFDAFGNTDKLNILLELPNNFDPQKSHDNAGLYGERNKVKCTVSTKGSSKSALGVELFALPLSSQEAYCLQPDNWIDGNGDITVSNKQGLEYLDFVHPFDASGTEQKNYTNINESINTKDERKIGECCLQVGGGNYFNKWTDLKRIQIETPAGYRVVQTTEPAVWKDVDDNGAPMIWTEGWSKTADTTMVQVKRHAEVGEHSWFIDCYMKDIDELYNIAGNMSVSYESNSQDGGQWTISAQNKDYVFLMMNKEA